MSIGAIVGAVASLVVGAAVATATVVGLVSAQSGTSGDSPANVNAPVVEYGTTE